MKTVFAGQAGKIDHSTAGAQLIYRKLASRGQEGKFLAQFSALALASHHSGLIDCLTPDGKNNFQRRMDKPDEDTHFTEAMGKLPDIAQQLDEILAQPVEQRFYKKLYEELKETGDSKETLAFKRGLLARFLLSCLLDADRLNTADFETPENELMRNYGRYHPWPTLIERLERKFVEFDRVTAQMDKANRAYEVNQLRAEVAQACRDFADQTQRGLPPDRAHRRREDTGELALRASPRRNATKKDRIEGFSTSSPTSPSLTRTPTRCAKSWRCQDDATKSFSNITPTSCPKKILAVVTTYWPKTGTRR